MRRFHRFVKAAGERGWPSMIGTFTFVAISILEHFWDHNLASYVFVVLAAAIFCWGAFSAWSDADKKVKALEQQLADRLPHISGEVCLGYLDAGKIHDRVTWEDALNGCTVTVYITATNLNDQPAWFRMSPEATITMYGREYRGAWRHICSQLLSANDPTIAGDKMIRDFFDQRYLDVGFSMAKGVPLQGWLMFYLEEFDKNLAFGKQEVPSKVEILLKDTLGGQHCLKGELPLKVALVCLSKNLLPKQQSSA